MRQSEPGWWEGRRDGRAVLASRQGTRLGAHQRLRQGTRPGTRLASVARIARPRGRCGLLRARAATTAVEFAICSLAMVLIIVGFVEFGRLTWSFEVLQEVAAEGARCMGLGASACSAGGVYNSANTTAHVVALANARGVVITTGMVALSTTAICGGASGFSQVTISYSFVTAAPLLLTSLVHGFTVPASACFPNHS